MTDDRWNSVMKALDSYTEIARSVRRPLYKRRQLQQQEREKFLDVIRKYVDDVTPEKSDEYTRGVRAALDTVKGVGANSKRGKCVEVIEELLTSQNEVKSQDEESE